MKKKLLTALLAVLALAIAAVTVFAADTPAYTVDENGNITLDVRICLRGDVTGEGKINMADVISIRRYLADSENYPLTEADCADATGEGKINMADVITIRRYIADSENYPIPDPDND